MAIGEVIRKYRKERQLTQEEMAQYLGVTAPAVNKWEKGSSAPDISLLAPIARLLGITLDELLSFQDELSQNEVNAYVQEIDACFRKEEVAEVYEKIKRLLQEYPNCESLILNLTVMLDAQRIIQEAPDAESYDAFIAANYKRVLGSENEELRLRAADALYGFYLRQKQYDEAESCLQYYSFQNPERKRKQAVICQETGRIADAYKTLEELLFEENNFLNMVFNNLYLLAMAEKDYDKASYLIGKVQSLAEVFEMGEFHRISLGLDLALAAQNADEAITVMDRMLSSFDSIFAFREARLYEDMTFQEGDPAYLDDMRQNMIKSFLDQQTYGFLKTSPKWEKFMEKWVRNEDIL